jgi:hypothetical protein
MFGGKGDKLALTEKFRGLIIFHFTFVIDCILQTGADRQGQTDRGRQGRTNDKCKMKNDE